MKNKLFTALLLGLLVACILPISALALPQLIDDAYVTANGSTYDLSAHGHVAGDIITITATTPITLTGIAPGGVGVTCAPGTDLILDNAEIDNNNTSMFGIVFSGSGNTLTLAGSNRILSGEGFAGISVNTGTSLTIDGSGDLGVAAGFVPGHYLYTPSGAGIGSDYGSDCGTIIINGGMIFASGNNLSSNGGGAGIGGGAAGSGGTIIINGGEVFGYADFGAGIGAGAAGSGGTITINSGKVSALSELGAGIGGGYQGSSGTVTIHSGEVESSSNAGAGIGAGSEGTLESVTIKGGEVVCNSNSGAGIGGGSSGGPSGTISIEGGEIRVTSYDGAGIGGGFDGHIAPMVINISGGESGCSSTNGDGIGAGYRSPLSTSIITISGNAFVGAESESTEINHAEIAGASITIEDYAQVYSISGKYIPTPNAPDHSIEPGTRLEASAADLTGVGDAYNFTSPSGWEDAHYGYFREIPEEAEEEAENPRTGDYANHTWAILVSAVVLAGMAGYVLIRKKAKA